MDPTTVLMISRGTLTGGADVAACLKKIANMQCIMREDLLQAVNRFGDLASRMTDRVEKATEDYELLSELRHPYEVLMKQALLNYVREGHLAYLGYSGHLLLGRVRHIVRIRLIAPEEMRIARGQQVLGESMEEARTYVRRVDQERNQWARWMYGEDLRDPALYDICLNLDRLPADSVCNLLYVIMQEPAFQPTAESIEQVENDYIATQVLAKLVLDSRTSRYEFGATLQKGILQLVGPYLDGEILDTIRAIATSVEGINNLHYEPGYAPAFSMSTDVTWVDTKGAPHAARS